MIHFIHNIGDYFASNYFDEDFGKKVIEKSGYSTDAIKGFDQQINKLKPEYFKLKQRFIENHLRVKDKINLSHEFHTKVLNALGYDAAHTDYHQLFPISDKAVLPIRHILYRGVQPHLMVMEMHAMIKTSENEVDGLFEQRYSLENDDKEQYTGEQKYHRSQWADIFTVPDGVSISPMIVKEAINKLFHLPTHQRPKYVLLCSGNQYFLLECEKFARGSYLQLDLEALFDDAAIQKDFYAVFYLLLGKDLLAPTAEMVLMEQLDEDSHKAAYEVTKDLKEGVIHAVERLANEAVQDLVNRKGMTYDEIDANRLKDDCLNMVYRLLFLFYAESREDLDILPSNDEVYERGYSLEMLRDLEQVPLISESSRNGYFFHQSLYQLFDLLHKGFREHDVTSKSFKIRHLDSPMFDPNQLHYLKEVQIRNHVWQDVICELSLSKKQKKKNRGRISYANLGINQLGSVYESLLAFRGFLAESDYIEVHRKRKKGESSEKVVQSEGSYLVPRYRIDDFDREEVYHELLANDEEELKIIKEGTFIYRLSGRDRQKSASYYTPEVLTQTTVKYTLKPILERLDKGELKALDLLDLKILEPAMGAAAFHNEVINQLAQAYLTYRQQELRRQVDPNKYQEELQKIKAHIALNNVYGVDLNPTAVELGKLSLWLNVIHKDMQTPFFGYRLGVGNAVVGSWLKVFKHKDFSFEPKGKAAVKKEWWNTAPKHLKFGKEGILRKDDEIYHFLLPDVGMAASGGIKLLKEAYATEAKRVSDWRKEFCAPLQMHEYQRVQKIARAIDILLEEHYSIQKNIALITEVNADYFGNPNNVMELDFQTYSYEQKQQFAQERLKPNAPYYKLKQIMDYWCSLWFWDVRDAKDLPTRTEWYTDIEQILNINLDEAHQISSNEKEALRDYRKDKKAIAKRLAEALKQSTTSLFTNERAALVGRYAEQYKFFHYELEFIEVFRERNGFDVAVGNPPWLKVTFEEKGLMSEIFPELEIRKVSAPQVKKLQADFLTVDSQQALYFVENIENEASSVFMNAYQNYPLLKGQQTNLYKCVLENGLYWINEAGYLGLIHPEGIYDDPKGQELRKIIYKRLKYHFQFLNVFNLFVEVHHRLTYSVNVYRGKESDLINFESINNIFHPSSIDLYYRNDKKVDLSLMILNQDTNKYEWNLIGNNKRVISFSDETLRSIANIFEGKDYYYPKLLSIHTKDILNSIIKLNNISKKLIDFRPKFNEGFHETEDVKNDIIKRKNDLNLDDVLIFSGSHISVSNLFFKTAKKICIENSDYDNINLLKLENFQPRTNYKLCVDAHQFEYINKYKIGMRKMLSLESERTLQPALMFPGTAHVNGIISLYIDDFRDTIKILGCLSSVLYDFLIKSIGSTNLYGNRLENLPIHIVDKLLNDLFIRVLKLNCLNNLYFNIWKEFIELENKTFSWSISDEKLEKLNYRVDEVSPLINHFSRRQALVEIDVIVAISIGLELDDLIGIYNNQFSISKKFESDTWYDINGNIVFTPSSKSLKGVGLDRSDWEKIKDLPAGETYEHTITKSELYQGEKVTYYAPFTKCDRVEDYKRAWAHFEERFKED